MTEPTAAPMPRTLPVKALRWLIPLLVVHAGVFFALASPKHGNALVWPFAFVPMFLALDLTLRGWTGGRRNWLLRVLACTYPVGVLFALITGDWVVNTAHVFGGMPVPLAYAVSWFGYGTLHGLELFAFVGLPFALTLRRPLLGFVLVPLWATVGEVFVPRFLFFAYGQLMFPAAPLVQFADVLGSGGLNLLWLPLQLLLFAWIRHGYAPGEPPLKPLAVATVALALLFGAAWAYGTVQMQRWTLREAAGRPVTLVGIQPNFSLQALASNPALAHSDRQQNLAALLEDSAAALRSAPRNPDVPRVLLWPESVYPRPYFIARGMREVVELWMQQADAHLMLASVDARRVPAPDGRTAREVYGMTVHVGPEGSVRDVYRKIALIPFGETVPLGDWIPLYRDLLLEWVPTMSQFNAGTEHTVFTVENGVGIAPMICFDAADPAVAQGMAANGARLGVVLANLAWFGRTTVSEQFGFYVRFRALENRMPILMLSQNGQSWLIDTNGQDATPRLPQFEHGAFVDTVRAPEQTSFYALHAQRVHMGFLAGLMLTLAVGWGPALLAFLRKRRRGS